MDWNLFRKDNGGRGQDGGTSEKKLDVDTA